MITTRTFLTSLIFTTMAAGLVGMNGLPQEDAPTPNEQASPKIKPALQAQPPAEKTAESPVSKAPALTEPAKQVTRLVKIYALKNLAAPTAKRLLRALTADSDQLRMEVDLQGNSIIVFGSGEQHSSIESALSEIDQLLITQKADTDTKSDPDEPRFLPYARDARPAEIWLHKMLQTPVPKLDFPGETPLSEILEQISTYYTMTYGKSDSDTAFTFTFMPDILELELEGIVSLEDVLIEDITLNDVTLENALQFIFDQTDPGLTYEIRNEVMVITTDVKAEDSLYTRVYEVEHLLHTQFEQHVDLSGMGGGGIGFGGGVNDGGGLGGSGLGGGGLGGGGLGGGQGGGGGGFFSVQFGGQSAGGLPQTSSYGDNTGAQSATNLGSKMKKRKRNGAGRSRVVNFHIDMGNLTETIQSVTSPPCQWMNMDGEGGTINPVGNTLVIYQTQAAHQKIVRLLNLLTSATKPAAK